MSFDTPKPKEALASRKPPKEGVPAGPLVLPDTAKAGETKDQLADLKNKLGDVVSGKVLEALEERGVDANVDGKLPEGVAPAGGSLGAFGLVGATIVDAINSILVDLGLKNPSEGDASDVQSGSGESGGREAVASKEFGKLMDPKAPVFSFPEGTPSMLTSVKGPRKAPKTNHGHGSTEHKGYDIGVPVGTPIVLTAETATVERMSYQGDGAGNYIVLKLPDGSEAFFMHLKELPPLKKGQVMKAGDMVAVSGNTGNSSGPHVHFEVHRDGDAVEPEAWLAEAYHREHEDEARVA